MRERVRDRKKERVREREKNKRRQKGGERITRTKVDHKRISLKQVRLFLNKNKALEF